MMRLRVLETILDSGTSAAGGLFLLSLLTACSVSESSSEHVSKCDTLIAQARDAESLKDYNKARPLLDAALKEAQASTIEFQVREVLKEQSKLFLSMHDFQNSEESSRQLIKMYDDVIKQNETRALIEDRARASMILGDALMAEDKNHDAWYVYKGAAEDLKRAAADMALQGKIGHRCALLKGKPGVPEDLEQVDIDSVIESGESGKIALGTARNVFARAQLQEALGLYKAAREKCLAVKDYGRYCEATSELGLVCFILGDMTTVKKIVQESEKDPRMHNLAAKYTQLTPAVKALLEPTYASARTFIQKNKLTRDETVFLFYKNARIGATNVPAKRVILDQMVLATQDQPLPEGVIDVVKDMGSAYSQSKEFQKGSAWMLEQLKVNHASSADLRGAFLEQSAFLLLQSGRKAQGERQMRESIGLTESSTNPFWTDFKAIKAATLIADYTAVGESKKAVEIGLLAANDPAVKASPFRLEVQVQLARAFSADKQWQKSLYRYDQVLPDLQSSRDRLFSQAQAERASVAKKLAQK